MSVEFYPNLTRKKKFCQPSLDQFDNRVVFMSSIRILSNFFGSTKTIANY